MDKQINLSEIKDINVLKSMAYDCVLAIETQQANLRMIQARLAELEKTK